MRTLTIILSIAVLAACAADTNRYSANSDFYAYQVQQNQVLERYAFDPQMMTELSRTPQALKPTEKDFLTVTTDLNGDGRNDIIGTINHYKFAENGAYQLFVLMANEYGYTELPDSPRIKSFDLKVLDTVSNGLRDISVDGRTVRFNGSKYE